MVACQPRIKSVRRETTGAKALLTPLICLACFFLSDSSLLILSLEVLLPVGDQEISAAVLCSSFLEELLLLLVVLLHVICHELVT